MPGIVEFKGMFNKDDIVSIESDGKPIAKGKVNYSNQELARFTEISEDERKDYFKKLASGKSFRVKISECSAMICKLVVLNLFFGLYFNHY